MDFLFLSILGFFVILGVAFVFYSKSKTNFNSGFNTSQDSYQHYAKFYDTVATQDTHFEYKLSRIIDLVKYQKTTDIREIADEIGCTLEEAILKINYLESNKILNNIHIDRKTYKIIECSLEDEKLIRKYMPYIYYNHFTIEEIAQKVRRSSNYSLEDTIYNVYEELMYLIDNDLVHGIKIDPIDRRIIYLATDKNKTKRSKELVTVNCPRCGALNDINCGLKTRCLYCNSILEDK